MFMLADTEICIQGLPTANCQSHEETNTYFQTDQVEKKVTMIVDTDTIIYPWAMAENG